MMRLHDKYSAKEIASIMETVSDESNQSSRARELRREVHEDLASQDLSELAESLAGTVDDFIGAKRASAGGLSPFHTSTGRRLRNG